MVLLISKFHHWLSATDGTGATVRAALLDFRKGFDLVDHHVLVTKLFSLGIKPSVINWIIDFLRDRQQRATVSQAGCMHVPAGVPKGTRLGPWLFLVHVMINNLVLSSNTIFHKWKFADETTVSEVLLAAEQSHLQEAVDYINDWSRENPLQLNPTKCKELLSCFKKTPPSCDKVRLTGVEFEGVPTAKVLGVTIRSDFIPNYHIDTITDKAAKRLYLLRELKIARIGISDLVQFYCSVIRSVLEYACQLFRHSLPGYLSDNMERIQRRAMRVIFPDCEYRDALIASAHIPTLYERPNHLCSNLFDEILY